MRRQKKKEDGRRINLMLRSKHPFMLRCGKIPSLLLYIVLEAQSSYFTLKNFEIIVKAPGWFASLWLHYYLSAPKNQCPSIDSSFGFG